MSHRWSVVWTNHRARLLLLSPQGTPHGCLGLSVISTCLFTVVLFRRYRMFLFIFTTADKYYIVTRMDLTVRDVFESVREGGYPDLYLSLVFVSFTCNLTNCKSAKEYKAPIT